MKAFLIQQGLPLNSIQPEVRFVYYASLHWAHSLQTDPHVRPPPLGPAPLALLHRIISESVLRSLELIDVE